MLEFKRIHIRNFLSLGEVDIDLSGNEGFILIDAENRRKEDNSSSNGSGKSSIFESMIWCLTGETLRGYKDVVNKYQSDSCSVCVDFSFKSSDWKIIRTREKSGAQGLKVFKDGSELEYKGVRDAQSVLERNLPEITTKFLGSTIILGQGLPQRFTNNSPSGRKAVLEELSNADYMITQVKEAIKRRETALTEEYSKASSEAVSLTAKRDTTISFKNKYLCQLEELSKVDLEKEKLELQDIEKRGKELRAKTDEFAKISSDLTMEKAVKEEAMRSLTLEQDKSMSEILAEKSEKIKNLSEIFSKEFSDQSEELYSQLSALTKQEDTISKNVSQLKSMIYDGFCPTCKQKLPGISDERIESSKVLLSHAVEELEKISSEKIATEEKLKNLRSEIDLKKSDRIKEIDEEFSKKLSVVETKFMKDKAALIEIIQEISIKLGTAKTSFSEYSDRTQDLRDQYSVKKLKIDNYLSTLQNLNSQIEQCNIEIESLDDKIKSQVALRDSLQERIRVIKSMETFASRDFRGILLEDIISNLAVLISKNAEKVYGKPLTEFYQDGNNIVIGFDGKEYESLSGGEKQKLDVIIQMSLRELIIKTSGIESNLAVFDEVFDALDETGCNAIIELLMGLQIKTFVITHRPSLNIPYDQVLKVVKHENGVASVEFN